MTEKITTSYRNNKTKKNHYYIIDNESGCWNWDSVNKDTGDG